MMRSRGRTIALAAACGAVALSGCQSLRRERPKPPVPAPVVVPAPPAPAPRPPPPPPAPPPPPKSCVPRTLGPAPRYPDSDGALRNAPGAADRYQLMAAGRILRQQRLEDLERVIAGCR